MMSAPTAPYHQPATLEEVRTLWIGDLPYWADENYLRVWFAGAGEVFSLSSSHLLHFLLFRYFVMLRPISLLVFLFFLNFFVSLVR